MTRKIITAIMLLIVTTSGAFASVPPQQALSDPRIAPYVENTKQTGAGLLPGRYMHTKEIDQRTGGQKILAPTSLIVEIMPLNPQQNTYSVNADLWGNELFPMYMAMDFSGPVPILRTYAQDEDSGEYELITEDFAVVMSDGQKHIWLLGSTETGEIRYMYPLNESWFPEGWYSGTWKGTSGTSCTFSQDGQAKINGQSIGKYIVSDNRIVITRNDGSKEVLYAALNNENNSLVITFMTGEEMTAEVFTRSSEKPAVPSFPPAKPKKSGSAAPTFTPPQPQPQSTASDMPSEFPEMPNVEMPKPALNIDGVWGAYVNNQQWVLQYKGSQYFGWINGQPSEMGVFRIDGSTITGTNNNGVSFTAELELDASGRTLTMKFQNGSSITYQRLQ